MERKPQPQQPNASAIPRPHGNNNNVVKSSEPKPVVDLLGMGDPAPEPVKPVQTSTAAIDNNDEFDLFMKAPNSNAQTVPVNMCMITALSRAVCHISGWL